MLNDFRLYPEFCVNSALDVKQSKIFTRRHCNSRPPLQQDNADYGES